MSAMTLEQVRRWAENTPASSGWRAKERDEAVAAIDAHLTAHAKMMEKVREVIKDMGGIPLASYHQIESWQAKLAVAIGDAK